MCTHRAPHITGTERLTAPAPRRGGHSAVPATQDRLRHRLPGAGLLGARLASREGPHWRQRAFATLHLSFGEEPAGTARGSGLDSLGGGCLRAVPGFRARRYRGEERWGRRRSGLCVPTFSENARKGVG